MINAPLILTLAVDSESQAYFDGLRKKHFPPERNFLNAHLTLFHQLPDEPEIYTVLKSISLVPFELEVTGLRFLGAGVAFNAGGAALHSLHEKLKKSFTAHLIPQDRQPFQPHFTIQNKVAPDTARLLFKNLTMSFHPFTVQATGLNLWRYLGGPWEHVKYIRLT